MEKNNNISRRRKKNVILSIIITLAIILGVVAYSTFLAPKPMGDRMQLIHRAYFGYLPFSDSDFSTEYYYATDMSLDELATYFKKAKLTSPSQKNLIVYYVDFFNSTENKGFTLRYYSNKEANEKIKLQAGKNLIIVPDRHYDIAKDSL